MGMPDSTLASQQSLRPSQITDMRLAASKMTGLTRRAFQAEMALKYCGGNPGEWPPLRQAAFSMAGSDTDVPEAVAPSRPRLSHCWASQPLQS